MAHIGRDFDGPMTGEGISSPRQPPARPSRHVSKWRPVDRELPVLHEGPGSFSDRVLVRVVEHDGSARVAIDTYTGLRWRWSANGDRVSHWRPLPSPEIGS